MMIRTLRKLASDYETVFQSEEQRKCRRGQIFTEYYLEIRDIALHSGRHHEINIFGAVDIALKAGIMIGYRAGLADATDKSKTASQRKRISRSIE